MFLCKYLEMSTMEEGNADVALSDITSTCQGPRKTKPLRPGALATLNEQFLMYNAHVFHPRRRENEFTSTASSTQPNTYIPADIKRIFAEFPESGPPPHQVGPRQRRKSLKDSLFANSSLYRTEFQPFPEVFIKKSTRYKDFTPLRAPYGTLLDGETQSVYQADYVSPTAMSHPKQPSHPPLPPQKSISAPEVLTTLSGVGLAGETTATSQLLQNVAHPPRQHRRRVRVNKIFKSDASPTLKVERLLHLTVCPKVVTHSVTFRAPQTHMYLPVIPPGGC